MFCRDFCSQFLRSLYLFFIRIVFPLQIISVKLRAKQNDENKEAMMNDEKYEEAKRRVKELRDFYYE